MHSCVTRVAFSFWIEFTYILSDLLGFCDIELTLLHLTLDITIDLRLYLLATYHGDFWRVCT